MRSFFKIFFATLLALIIFFVIGFFIMIGIVGSLASKDRTEVSDKTILMLDLSKEFPDNKQASPMALLSGESETPGLYDVIRLIRHAKDDENVSGIYILANSNENGAAASNELRQALLDFKTSKKFTIAYGDVMSQQSYLVASAADRIYLNPVGSLNWLGFSVTLPFLKGTLDKLDIQAQIFYAGKFKSATEPFRVQEMTPENKLQTSVWLNSIYYYFLQQASASRGIDTATLHRFATTASIQTSQDALSSKLVDALKYDDEVRTEIKNNLKLGMHDKMNFLSINEYKDAVSVRKSGSDRIALILAEGTIMDGEGTSEEIGGERYRALIRKARLDKNTKAIVLRVNSGGGSALASEIIWRELELAKSENKLPVVVSFGDVAASGGYYIACGADSIFAHPNTITGSIGVFGLVPNMENFFKNKLGVTFDGVKTAPYADAGTVVKPLNEQEKQLIQNSIERIYTLFLSRVAKGRNKGIVYIDSIAQGRVWSGSDALRIGLVDRLGNLDDALASAARMAKLKDYGIREYPESESWFKTLLNKKENEPAAMIKAQVGEENYKIFQQVMKVKEMTKSVQARLPYEIIFH